MASDHINPRVKENNEIAYQKIKSYEPYTYDGPNSNSTSNPLHFYTYRIPAELCNDDEEFHFGLDEITFDNLDEKDSHAFIKKCFKYKDDTNVVRPVDFEKVEQKTKDIINWCIDFLLYQRDEEGDEVYGKYITIWSFLYNFLKIEKETYAYVIMSMLSHYEILEYGTGIRCGWIKHGVCYDDKKCPDYRIITIQNWIKNEPSRW